MAGIGGVKGGQNGSEVRTHGGKEFMANQVGNERV